MLLKLNAGHNQILYHFCRSWEDLYGVVKNGLNPGEYGEYTWERGKTIKRDEDAYSKFASLTRNPQHLLRTSDQGWRYGVILDARYLGKYKLKPYAFYERPGRRNFALLSTDSGWIASPAFSEGYAGHWISISDDDAFDLLDWCRKSHVNVYEVDEDEMEDRLIDWELDDKYDPDECLAYMISFTLGDSSVAGSEGSDAHTLNVKDIPSIFYRISTARPNESEERYYPTQKKDVMNIKKALLGVLIPDTEYFSEEREDFSSTFPDVDVYIYRDPDADMWDTERLKKMLRLNPEVKQLYRYPR